MALRVGLKVSFLVTVFPRRAATSNSGLKGVVFGDGFPPPGPYGPYILYILYIYISYISYISYIYIYIPQTEFLCRGSGGLE